MTVLTVKCYVPGSTASFILDASFMIVQQSILGDVEAPYHVCAQIRNEKFIVLFVYNNLMGVGCFLPRGVGSRLPF